MTQPIRRRVVTQRRRRPFIAGIWLATAGVAVTIVGSLLLVGNQAMQVLAAEDRASVPSPLRFEAEEGSYVVLLLPTTVSGGTIAGDPVAQLTCDVALADGTTALLRGSRQSSSVETSAGETVGSFDAVAGPTTVTCDFTGSPDVFGYFVAVAPQRNVLNVVGVVALVSGILALVAGAAFIVIGVRGRAVIQSADQVRPEMGPISETAARPGAVKRSR